MLYFMERINKMSERALTLQRLYKRGIVTLKGLQKAVTDGTITQEEYNIIVGA